MRCAVRPCRAVWSCQSTDDDTKSTLILVKIIQLGSLYRYIPSVWDDESAAVITATLSLYSDQVL